MKDNDFILLSDTNTQPSQADLKITSVFDFTQGVYVTFLSDFPISHIQFGFYLNVPETTNLIYIYESDESETDSQKIYYNQGFWNFHKAFYYLHQKTLIYGNKQYYYEQFQLKILQNQIQATFDFNIFYAKFYHPKQKNCDPNCFLSSTDTPTKCLRCSETKELVNGACLCKNKQDIRNNYIQCSYRTIALVQPYLDSKQPILTIDFGTKIILDQNVSLSKEFCYLFIQDPDGDQDLSSLGENPQCTVDGSKFVVYLGNGATINENYQIQPLQKVFQITPETFVSIFYNSTVTQNIPDGPPILQFNYKTIESTCNDIQITLIGIQNDAGRGFQKFKWSLKSLNKSTSQSNLDQINKIIDYSNRYQTTSLIITKGLVPADSKLVIQFDYQLIIKKSGSQSLEISYQIQKALQVSFISPEQEQIYRYMSLKYQFTFTTLLCSDQGQQIFLYPIDISIYSEQLPYLNTQIQNKSIQNLDVDIRPYTLAENKISTFNVTASLNSDPSINATVIVFIKTLKTPIQVSIDGGNQNQADYKSQYQISATVRDYEIENPKIDQGISLQWFCQLLQDQQINPCSDYQGNPISFKDNQNPITIAPNTFKAYSTVKFILIGNKDTRSSYYTSVCLFADINIPPLSVIMKEKSSYNLNEDIVAEIVYKDNISSDLLSYAGALLYKNQIVGAIKFDFHTVRFRLWDYFSNIASDENLFQIRFSVYNPYYVMPSLNIRNIKINFPPSNCQFLVYPQEGKSLITSFNLTMSQCQAYQSITLTYQFFYYNNYDEYLQELQNPYIILRRQLQDQSQNSIINTYLPQGNLTLMAQAIDSKLAAYNTTFNISVSQFSNNPQEVVSVVNQNLQQMSQQLIKQKVVNLNIIGEELSKSNNLAQSDQINALKQTVLAQMINQTQLLSNQSLLATFTNKASAALQNSITTTASPSVSSDLLLQQIQSNIKNQINYVNGNDFNQFQQNNNLLMQNLVDTFKMINASTAQFNDTKFEQQYSQYLNMTQTIGELITNSTMIENQGPIELIGSQISLFCDRITHKNLINYARSSNEQIQNKTESYNVQYVTSQQNIYYNTNEFQQYVKKIQKKNPNLTSISQNQLIFSQIENANNQQRVNDSFIYYSFNKTQSKNNQSLVCIQQNQTDWNPFLCTTIKNTFNNGYKCICKGQKPTTLIESISDVFFDNQNIETVFGSQGVKNLENFNEPYKYIAFWLLTSTTLIQVVLWKYGKTLDIFDQQKSQQIVVPQTTIENAVEKEELKQDKQEQPVDEVNSRQTKRQGSYASCLNFIQQEQVQTEKQQSELKLEQCKSIEKIISNQEDNNKQETNPQIPGEQTLFNNEQANQTTSIQTNYLEKSSLKRIVLHHSFFCIFYIYDQQLSRPLRFQDEYLNIIHSLAISILFSDYSEIAQKIVIAILNVVVIESFLFLVKLLYLTGRSLKIISISLKIIVFGIYFYIILALVSGASPSEANQFFSLFLISTAMTFVIVQFSLSFLKDQLIKRYSFTEQNPFLIKYMFKLFKLEDFLKSL